MSKIQDILRSYKSLGLVYKNVVWLIGDKVFSMVLGVIVTAAIARYFGPEQFGQYNYSLSFVLLFTAIATLGLEALTVKTLLEEEYDEGIILCTSLLLRLLGSLVLLLFSMSTIKILEYSDYQVQIMVFIMSSAMIFKSFEVIEYWIQAKQKSKISSSIRMIAFFIASLLKIFLIFNNSTIIHLSLIYLLEAVVVSVFLIIAYLKFRDGVSSWKFDFSYAKKILSQSWYLIISGLMITLYMRIDQVMLGAMLPTKQELGIYSAAVQIATMWYFVPMAIITAFRPNIMISKQTDENKYQESLQLLYCLITWVSISFGIIILFFSNLIVNLVYGSEYHQASTILKISVWAGIFALLGSARSVWLISEGKQKYTLIYTSVGLVVNLIMNVALIPRLGAVGAAVSTIFAQFFANIVALAFFKETRISTIMILRSFNPFELIKYSKKNAT